MLQKPTTSFGASAPETGPRYTLMLKSLAKLFGGSDEKVIAKLQPTVDEINRIESEYERLSDLQLLSRTGELIQMVGDGADLELILPEAFATVREASKRTLGQRHYDVQLVGGIVLHQGKIAEMRTGEGKTLVATLPAYLNSLTGEGVHVVTVNDYLARRDAHWMGEVYAKLGVTIGALQNQAALVYDPDYDEGERGFERLRSATRQEAYASDITYGTNNEFGFDYLRDNMVTQLSERVQRGRSYAIVDEVDNILIDEARTPLIISGPADMSARDYLRYARVAPTLQLESDYTIDEKHRTVALSQEGISKLEKALSVSNLYGPENFGTVHHIENALKANVIFNRDREYVVQNGEVVIVDEFTGRLMQGRRYSDGLHQAIEAKEGVRIQPESITYATITLQNYFRLYQKLAGMTGTAATEAEEFNKIYKLEVVSVPTNQPMIREDTGDLIFRDQGAKYRAVVREIEERHTEGQPVLVGTTDIDKSEVLSDMLKSKNIPHEVLNAKQHQREALIVAQAGKPGAVTVATNMAGRGTDIVLGGSPDIEEMDAREWETNHQGVLDVGGLHIIGTERHEARRIDNQLRGRAGRQGDPGATQFYVALDDELMRRFGGDRIRSIMDWAGFEEDVPIENGMIDKSIENAQVKVEAYHFDMRKHLVEYDDVVNTHRDVIYGERNKVLSGADLKSNIQQMVGSRLSEIVQSTIGDGRPSDWDVDAFVAELGTILPPPDDLLDYDQLTALGVDGIEDRVLTHAEQMYEQMEEFIGPEVVREIERRLMLQAIDANWVQHLTSMENLRQGIGLHAFGQRDPLVMYKKEGMDQFQRLQDKIQSDIAHSIFRLQLSMDQPGANGRSSSALRNQVSGRGQSPPRMPERETDVSRLGHGSRGSATAGPSGRKVGRNAPCPCGSGKKYKRCHGG